MQIVSYNKISKRTSQMILQKKPTIPSYEYPRFDGNNTLKSFRK